MSIVDKRKMDGSVFSGSGKVRRIAKKKKRRSGPSVGNQIKSGLKTARKYHKQAEKQFGLD